MSASNRVVSTKTGLIKGGIFAAAICVLIIGWGLLRSADYEREANNHRTEFAEYTSEKVAEACIEIPNLERIKCVDQAFEAKRDYEATQYDLEAQRKSALWAYIMGAAAVIGMALSAVGIWLVKTTFDETRRSNEIASATADGQLRPYLAIDTILPEKPTLETDTIQIVFKNFGQTPAQNIHKEMGIAFVPVGLDSWPIPIAKIDLGREIAPGHIQKSTIELALWGEEWAKVIAGDGAFRIFLRVAYSGLGIEREPLEASVIFSMHGAMHAVSKITGPIKDGS